MDKFLAITQAVTAVLTLAVLIITIRLAHGSKATDAVIECNRRFDELFDKLRPIIANDPKNAYGRFFSLQLYQYLHWENGFIPDRVFHFWMKRRAAEWPGELVPGTSYGDGWKLVKSEFDQYSDFQASIDQAIKHNFALPKRSLWYSLFRS